MTVSVAICVADFRSASLLGRDSRASDIVLDLDMLDDSGGGIADSADFLVVATIEGSFGSFGISDILCDISLFNRFAVDCDTSVIDSLMRSPVF